MAKITERRAKNYEAVKKYKAKMKGLPGSVFKKADAQRKQLKRAERTEEQKKSDSAAGAERKRLSRQRKLLDAIALAKAASPAGGHLSPAGGHLSPAYSGPKPLNKASNRIRKSCPSTPRRRRAALIHVCRSEGLLVSDVLQSAVDREKLHARALPRETEMWVLQMYEEYSSVSPGECAEECVFVVW
jgi:hypothetical protein